MMVSVPAIAPASPPDTGASSMRTPRSARRRAIDRAALGAIVLMSTKDGLRARRRPATPSA